MSRMWFIVIIALCLTGMILAAIWPLGFILVAFAGAVLQATTGLDMVWILPILTAIIMAVILGVLFTSPRGRQLMANWRAIHLPTGPTD